MMKSVGRRTAITSALAAAVAACTASQSSRTPALAQQGVATGNQVRITIEGAYRVIRSNGIPNHATGRFPNAGNPNAISAQDHVYRVPVNPQEAARPTPLGLSPFGVALNGIPFDPGAAEFWRNDRNSGWQYEALSGAVDLGLDAANAHVQPTGAYHYHGLPAPLLAGQSAQAHSHVGRLCRRRFSDLRAVRLCRSAEPRRRRRAPALQLPAPRRNPVRRPPRRLRRHIRPGLRVCRRPR